MTSEMGPTAIYSDLKMKKFHLEQLSEEPDPPCDDDSTIVNLPENDYEDKTRPEPVVDTVHA